MIDPESGVPAWRQLAAELRRRIDSGVYEPGGRVPSETHLGQEFGVGRATVRRAIAQLRAEGLITVRHGWGTRVREQVSLQEIAGEPGALVTVRMPTPQERAFYGLPDGVSMIVVTGRDGVPYAYPGDVTAVRIPSPGLPDGS